ncbi:MAG: hypothetical protein HC844_15150, partial [Tabrizicola sp.]|nr:hypothetical protein [Tabrizicola sp.]
TTSRSSPATRADDIRDTVGDRARIVANDAWPTTNSLYSMALCDGAVRGDLLVMNCDVLVHPLAMHRLLDAPGSAFLYDSSSGDAEEHMKVEFRHGRLVAMSKTLPAERSQGERVIHRGRLHQRPLRPRHDPLWDQSGTSGVF